MQQKRDDLKQTADTEIAILTEYASKVAMATTEEVKELVSKAFENMKEKGQKPTMGLVMQFLNSTTHLPGKSIDRSEVARIANEALKSL